MNMLLVVPPPGNQLFRRALGYGAKYGSLIAVLALLVQAAALAVLTSAPQVLVVALIVAPFVAVAGVLAGLACGLTAAVALWVLRRQVTGSRPMAGLVAGAGATLLPASAFAVAMSATSTPGYWLTVLAILTVLTFATASARGPAVIEGTQTRTQRGATSDHPDGADGGGGADMADGADGRTRAAPRDELACT